MNMRNVRIIILMFITAIMLASEISSLLIFAFAFMFFPYRDEV